MSTKTTIKRIALVAVSALGIGTLNVTAASAGNIASTLVQSISLAQVTSAPTINAAVAVNFGALVGDATGETDADTTTFTGYLSAYPSGGFAQVTASETATGTDIELWEDADGGEMAEAASGSSVTVTFTDASDSLATADVTATAATGAGKFSFTPTVAGAYTLTVWNDIDADGVIDIGEAVQTINLTVGGVAGYSHVLSSSIRNAAGTYNGTVDDEVRVSKVATTDGASIVVTLKDVNGNAFYGARVQADVSGPGYVDVVTAATAYADATARTDYLDLAADANIARVAVTADGTSGTSTITITVKNATTLAVLGTFTETVYFYGTVASLTATKNFNIARANATERGCSDATGCTSDGTIAETPFVTIVAKDADGNLVPSAALANAVTAKITDLSVISASTVTGVTAKATATTAGVSTDANGLGYFNASVAGTVGATSGSKTTVAYRTLLADGVTYVTSNAVEISIGGSVYTTEIAFDKTSYTPGEAMVITVTAKDSVGNPVYDGAASPEVSFSKAVGGSSQVVASDEYNGGVVSTSSTKPTIFAPVAEGEFIARATAAVAGVSSNLTKSATVSSDSGSSAAIDAANEATDAANAATDAANAAAEAADAATAAAQDAQAAVAALATQVAGLISGIKKQLTSLSNLIIKIQKKVKA